MNMDNKPIDQVRVAKNAAFLYARSIITLVLGLYTSRITLAYLGVQGYGVYNVISGFVTLFSVVSIGFQTAITRYYNCELGRAHVIRMAHIFSCSINILVILAIILLIFAETIGLWMVSRYLKFPESSASSVYWIYQFSVASFLIGIISLPYLAMLNAYEKFSTIAYAGIMEAMVRLAFIILLSFFDGERLVFYAGSLFLVILLVRIFYVIKCHIDFPEISYTIRCDKKLVVSMIGFSSWSFLGGCATIGNAQGLNIILNIFFGVIANAAKGIANQVSMAVGSLLDSFLSAVSPQLTKAFASGNIQAMYQLAFNSSKWGFFLLLIFVFPVCCEINFVLKVWLGEFPTYTESFIIIALINQLIESLSKPFHFILLSSGNMRIYMLLTCLNQLVILPLSWYLLSLGHAPQVVFILNCIASFFMLWIKMFLLNYYIPFNIKMFFKDVLLRITVVTFVSVLSSIIFLHHSSGSIIFSVLHILCSFIVVLFSIYFIGLNSNERSFLKIKFDLLFKK